MVYRIIFHFTDHTSDLVLAGKLAKYQQSLHSFLDIILSFISVINFDNYNYLHQNNNNLFVALFSLIY